MLRSSSSRPPRSPESPREIPIVYSAVASTSRRPSARAISSTSVAAAIVPRMVSGQRQVVREVHEHLRARTRRPESIDQCDGTIEVLGGPVAHALVIGEVGEKRLGLRRRAAIPRGTAAEAEAFLANLAYHEGMRHPASEHLDRAVGTGRWTRARVRARRCSWTSRTTCLSGQRPSANDRGGDPRRSRSRERSACARSRPPRCIRSGSPAGSQATSGAATSSNAASAIAEEIGSPLSAQCCGVLADLECNVGNLETCFALHKRAREHAWSSAMPASCAGSPANESGRAIRTGDWDEAVRGAHSLIGEAEAGTPNFMEGYCRAMRGRIRLA